jgi:proline dehydrogenase
LEKTHSQTNDPALLERLLFGISKRWIAGHSVKDAISAARRSNELGMSIILNYLGEENLDNLQIRKSVSEYLSLLDLLNTSNILGCVSIKPSQVGLAINYELCLRNLYEISEHARKAGRFVWIDMESVRYVEDTISIYLDIFKKNRRTGLVIQSYLRRSYSDLIHLVERGANIRLVKGAYNQDRINAFQATREIDNNFSMLMRFMLDHLGSDEILAIATHDSKLVKEAISLLKGREIIKSIQFQFLKGIRDELKRELVQNGFSVWEYAPYGERWLAYSARRIRERKRNIILLARSLIQS